MIYRRLHLLFLGLFLTSSSVLAQETTEEPAGAPTPFLMDSRTGDVVEMEGLVDQLASQDVIFLGEQHDNDAGHAFQLQVIQSLHSRGVDVVVSTEQFERDVQGVLNDYLANRITEEEFLANSRPWKNYPEHYRAIIEFAKENRIPVLAGNVPRRLASDVSMARTIMNADTVFLPRSTTAPEDSYWQNFQETMKGHGGVDASNQLKSFYASQCIKDDAMAETITDYLAVNPHRRKIVVHLCGHFHSDYGLGTVARVATRAPLMKMAIVTMENIPEKGEPKLDAVLRRRAHYIFWTVANTTPEETQANE
jgi:uncharacterized iron-regulated protein